MLITPDLAKAWLEQNNTHNRPISEPHWMRLAVDMIEGLWVFNGDSIRFSRDGVLLDGQHRLIACTEAKIPLDVNVVFGLDPKAMNTIDDQLVRTAGNQLSLAGVANANQVAALAGLLLLDEQWGIRKMTDPRCKPTKRQVEARVIDDWNGARVLQEATGRTRTLSSKLMFGGRFAGFCYCQFHQQDPAICERFFTELTDGVGLSQDSPVHLLRERLLSNKGAKARLGQLELLALMRKAWLAYKGNRTLRSLRWRSDGATPEEFPQI